MQQAVDVVEDGPLVDLLVLVVLTKLLQSPIGDVLGGVALSFLQLRATGFAGFASAALEWPWYTAPFRGDTPRDRCDSELYIEA